MSQNRTAIRRTAILAGALVALFLGVPAQVRAQVRVRLATPAPQGTSYHQALQAMGEKWRLAPACGVQLTIYPGTTMGSEVDIVSRMRVKQLQAAMLTVTGLSEIDPSVSALQKMPLIFQSLDEVDYVRVKLEPMLNQRLRDKGFVVLFWGDAGWARFFSRHPALVPDDFRRMKLFVGPGDPHQIDIMRALGFTGAQLEWSDALTGLHTGMVDAVLTAPFHALAMQFHTVSRNMLELNFVPLVGATVISKRTWDSLSPPCQEVILKSAAEAGEQIKARGRAEAEESIEAMKRRGLKVHRVTPQAQAEWDRLGEQVYPRIRGSIVPPDVFDETRRLLAEYRASKRTSR